VVSAFSERGELMLRFCLVALMIVFSYRVSAEEIGLSQKTLLDDEIPIGPVALCSVESIAGLLWQDGKYKTVNYKKSNYIIQKMDHRSVTDVKDVPNNISCFYGLGNEKSQNSVFKKDVIYTNMNLVSVRNLNRCYTIRAQGDPYAEKFLIADSCKEKLDIEENAVTIRCNTDGIRFDFQPSGEMLRYFTPSIDFLRTQYRDSIFVESGNCTKLY
jgi:hypothetical protein